MSDDLYPKPEHGWTCFHCGETFTTPGSAKDHFGFDPSCEPACRIKAGGEKGLLMALRRLESELLATQLQLHSESSAGMVWLRQAEARHHTQLIEAEQTGYDRGVADVRKMLEDQPVQS